jgi:DNA-binding beta-propeller fold protein YncE
MPSTRILKFDASGKFEAHWGSPGDGPGKFESITAIAVSPDNFVYVACGFLGWAHYPSQQRIQKFTKQGVFITQWSGHLLGGTTGLAIGPNGTVYAADEDGRILTFTSSGTFLSRFDISVWTCLYTYLGDERFFLAVGPDGSVYIMSDRKQRIQKYTASGEYVTQWGAEGKGTGQLWGVTGLAAGSNGLLYVLSGSRQLPFSATTTRVQAFTGDGNLVYYWGSFGIGNGQFDGPCGIAVAGDGSVYVSDTRNLRIQKFTDHGAYLGKWGAKGSDEGQFASPFGIAVGPDGTCYVADHENDRVQRFSSSGTYLGQWGSRGAGDGQFVEPCDVAMGPGGSVFVVDSTCRIQEFSGEGALLRQWSSALSQYEYYPCGLAVGPDASLYLAIPELGIKHFTAPGIIADAWGETVGSGPGQFNLISGIAVAADGTVYVTDVGNNRIQYFTPNGQDLGEWGTAGAGVGQFKHPWGVAVGSDGMVFVADTENCRIQRFGPTGVPLDNWGLKGNGAGLFLYPMDVAIASDGTVYVTDTDNHRIQRFVPTL